MLGISILETVNISRVLNDIESILGDVFCHQLEQLIREFGLYIIVNVRYITSQIIQLVMGVALILCHPVY
jgi:hypothetical protein